jgi:hypothetical protein
MKIGKSSGNEAPRRAVRNEAASRAKEASEAPPDRALMKIGKSSGNEAPRRAVRNEAASRAKEASEAPPDGALT